MDTNYTRVCDYCRRNVDVGEGIVESQIWYHDNCYLTLNGKRKKLLERKIENGQITAQEAKEYSELTQTIENIKSSPPGVPLSHMLNGKEPVAWKGSACKLLKLNRTNKQLKGIDIGILDNPNNALQIEN